LARVEGQGPADQDLRSRVEAQRRVLGDASTEHATFGAVGPEGVAEWYADLCSEVLGSSPTACRFYLVSAGSVAGLELADRRVVVVKAYQPRWTPPFLVAVASAQRRLAQSGVACAEPVIEPGRFRAVPFTVDTWLADPGMRDLGPAELTVSAAALAEVGRVLRVERLDAWAGGEPMRPEPGSLYPAPHSPLFDFHLDGDGAAWIDRLAWRARAGLEKDPGPAMLLHGDWSARNIRIAEGKLVAAYDWDSLTAGSESRSVGLAAATWRSTADTEVEAPGAEEVEEYLWAYVAAAGRHRPRTWWSAAFASALYTLAYAARCEHALQARFPHLVRRRARGTLERDGDRFLAMC
jgi:aminoglycoside phosphotransferase (APT) family kinase protein